MNTERFDERQLAARRKGITLAFYVVIAGLFLSANIDWIRGKSLFVSQMTLSYVMILLGITTMSCYFIFKDAFLTIKEYKNSLWYSLLYLLLGLFMLGTSFQSSGKLIENGQISENILGLVSVYWVLTGGCLVVRNFKELPASLAKLPWYFYLVALGEVGIILASVFLNWEKEPDMANLLMNFTPPTVLLLAGVLLPPKDHKIAKWIFILLGSFWFGYISLYYLIGFHNHLWQ